MILQSAKCFDQFLNFALFSFIKSTVSSWKMYCSIFIVKTLLTQEAQEISTRRIFMKMQKHCSQNLTSSKLRFLQRIMSLRSSQQRRFTPLINLFLWVLWESVTTVQTSNVESMSFSIALLMTMTFFKNLMLTLLHEIENTFCSSAIFLLQLL